VTQEQEDVTQEKGAGCPRPTSFQKVFLTNYKSQITNFCVSGGELRLLHVKRHHIPMRRPTRSRSRHRNLRCSHTVGAATVTKDDPAVPVAGVAVTVTVAGFGTTAGAVYIPVPLTVPFVLPPVTAQVTLWLAMNCCELLLSNSRSATSYPLHRKIKSPAPDSPSPA
jgi:hypothetical protein